MSEKEFKEYLDEIVRAAFIQGMEFEKNKDVNACMETAIENAQFEILENGIFK